ncbi:MAG: hypothetical protein LUG95_03475 [Clostridiales bacterium]|nr:hypothetical protein [Clostridiales bacterium]
MPLRGSSLGLKDGDTLTLYDLTVGMMLTSGNDSANAVATALAGSIENFAVMMNDRAEDIGMKNTYFVTPSGLDKSNHHSTAHDMALLTAQAVKSDIFCEIVSSKSANITISGEEVTVYNHNRLLSMDDNIFGVKTGYTEKAGRCLVSAENYNGNVLICVTPSCPNDWEDHLALYLECEAEYTEQKVKCEKTVDVVGAECDTFSCSYKGERYTLSQISVCEYIYPFVYAPIKKWKRWARCSFTAMTDYWKDCRLRQMRM